jgi:signal transduction histidine kinase
MRSDWREWWPEAAWTAFAVVCLGLMVAIPQWQPIPFHLIWVTLTLLYGLRLWSPRNTALLLLAVGALTGTAVATLAQPSESRAGELAEVPLMSLMFMVMVRHARQRAQAMRMVRRAAEREREFVRDASHQLRTPITIARGHTELIANPTDNVAPANDAKIVLGELERLERISDRLLILASAEHPGFLMLEPVPLDELIERAAARWTVVAEREWKVDTGAAGTVLVDAARIDCALDALIENAIKATAPGEAIALAARARGGVPVLSIADRGPGVAADHCERIFERFGRVPPAPGTLRNGTGLGLPMVRAIAEAHGGTAELVNGQKDWTTFELCLARFEAAPHASSNGRRSRSAAQYPSRTTFSSGSPAA